MKYLGIDYGTKRVGIALSDDEGVLAFPKTVLNNDKNLIQNIKKIYQEENVTEIVLGESKDFSGKDNPVMTEISKLKEELEKENFVIRLEPELLTSAEAEHIQGKGEMHDASAAAIILRSFLDKRNDTN